MLALAFAVSLCHNCAASSFLTTRRASHYALLVIASRVSQTHVGIYNTETQSRNGDNHAVMMNVGVGVGGVALPQLQRRVFLPRVAFLTTRRASHHALLVIASRVSQTHVGNLQYRNAMSLCHIRAAVINVGVGVGVGGVALPQLRSVVVSYHASCFPTTRRLFLPRVVGYCFASVTDTCGKFTVQERNGKR
jgi:uncharacterized membrane protein YbaN (DUF454 family)